MIVQHMGPVLEAFATVELDGQVSLAMLKNNAPSHAILLQAAVCKAPVCALRDFSDRHVKIANAPRIVGDMGIASKVFVSALLNGLADPVS
jgi:hypothetical protein